MLFSDCLPQNLICDLVRAAWKYPTDVVCEGDFNPVEVEPHGVIFGAPLDNMKFENTQVWYDV